MRYDYVVTLKRENGRRADLVGYLLLTSSVLVFILVQIRNLRFQFFLSTGAALLIAGLLINLAAARKDRPMRFGSWLLAAGIFWTGVPSLAWMAALFVLFAGLESRARQPLEIGFGAEGILVNTLFKKKIAWNALDAVLIKDGILTLDFKNNTLLQKEIGQDGYPDAADQAFNTYCREKIVNSQP